MNILFDSWSAQVLYQQAAPSYPKGANYPAPTGQRLNTLLGAIKSIGLSSKKPWNVSFTKPPIDAAQLKGVDVYISLTRYQGDGFAYEQKELDAIKKWSDEGGSVLLLTNHGDFSPPVGSNNWTKNDAQLAKLFGVTLKNFSVSDHGTKTKDSDVIAIHDTIPFISNQAPTITAHNSCIIVPPVELPANYTTIAEFPKGWTAYSSETGKTTPPPTPYFSIVVHGVPGSKAGKFLVIGNSGWTGDYGSPLPGCGLAPMQHNLMFILNCIGYLGGLTDIPKPGSCPK